MSESKFVSINPVRRVEPRDVLICFLRSFSIRVNRADICEVATGGLAGCDRGGAGGGGGGRLLSPSAALLEVLESDRKYCESALETVMSWGKGVRGD